MKGIISIGIIGLIFTIGSIIATVIPLVVTKYHLVLDVKMRYETDRGELALLTFLTEERNGKNIYRLLSEGMVKGLSEEERAFMGSELEKILGTDCVKLVNTSHTLISSECSPIKYTGSCKIFLPYNPDKLVERITVVYE
ncbi:MAG: hypothetical protein ACTSVF_01600 [Candidatus Asgardarchaeia archaeon]